MRLPAVLAGRAAGPQGAPAQPAASSVNLELRIWIRDPKNEPAMRVRYVERVKDVLDAVGIEIPFPQLTLHVAEGTPPGQAAETDAQNAGARRVEDGPRSPAE